MRSSLHPKASLPPIHTAVPIVLNNGLPCSTTSVSSAAGRSTLGMAIPLAPDSDAHTPHRAVAPTAPTSVPSQTPTPPPTAAQTTKASKSRNSP